MTGKESIFAADIGPYGSEKAIFQKKELAAIIELTGEMPDEGAGFKSGKGGNQYEMPENVFLR